MATARQTAANQQNAQKSTGPKTDEGKAASRGNALKHGLAGDGVVTHNDDAEVVAERSESWRGNYDLVTDEDAWLFEQMVVNSVRVDRCQRDETPVGDYHARRARACWDEDRRLEVEELGCRLAARPAVVKARLERTRLGCDWLIERWRALGGVLERGGAWDASHLRLADDLLGIDPALRAPGDAGTAPGSPQALSLVRMEIERLKKLKAGGVDELDDRMRASAEFGTPLEPPKAVAQLRRYEAACLRRFQWARARLNEAGRLAEPRPRPEPVAPPAPTPTPNRVAPAAEATHPMPTVATVAVSERPAAPGFRLRDALAPTPFCGNRQDRRRLAAGQGRSV